MFARIRPRPSRRCPTLSNSLKQHRRYPRKSPPVTAERFEPRLMLAAVAAEDAVVLEGNGPGPTLAVFNVRLYQAGSQPVTVDYATADETAAAPSDYRAASGTLTFAPGETLKTVTVEVTGDVVSEPNESFRLNLFNPTNAAVVGPAARGDIVEDDASYVSAEDAVVLEGDAGTVLADFLVHRLGSTAGTTTLAYSTANGTATAGDDFTATSGTLVFAPGETEKHVSVPVRGDDADEDLQEEFSFNLTDVTGATVAGGAARGTIVDDDLAAIAALNTFAFEGTGATPTDVVFTVVRTGDLGGTSTVQYATKPDRASSPGDFTAVSGTLVFGPGVATREVHVPYLADNLPEANEWFELTTTNATGATLVPGDARADIADDDASYVSIDDTAAVEPGAEGTPMTFTVRRTGSLARAASVQYAPEGGTAQTLSFEPGESARTFTVQAPSPYASGGSILVSLSNPVGVSVVRGSARGYVISDHESFAWVSGGGVIVEGTGPGQTYAEFTAHRVGATREDAQVLFFFTGETATPGVDYDESAAEGDFRFFPGETESTVRVPIIRDSTDEGTETFTLTLYLPNNVTLPPQGGTTARAMIVDDDGAATPGPATLYIDDVVVSEGDAGMTLATFTVNRVGPLSAAARVDYTTDDNSANAGSDYTATSGTLNFAAGQGTATITVPVLGDRLIEPTIEAFRVQLSNPVGAVLTEKTSGVGVITGFDNAALLVSDVDVVEGTGANPEAVFTVYRVGRPSLLAGATVVDYRSFSNSATAGADFTAASGQLVFEAGETQKTIRVPIVGDDVREAPNERFSLGFTSDGTVSGVLNSSGPAEAVIIDDDPSFIVVESPVLLEGDNPDGPFAAFVFRRVGSTGATATLNYATENGTANNADYDARSGPLSFAPGETEKTVLVHVIGNTVNEPDVEFFYLRLSNVRNAQATDLGDVVGAAIVDDDEAATPTYYPESVTVVEGNPEAPSVARVTVRRFGGAGTATSTSVGFTSGSAVADADFVNRPPILNFGPGDTFQTFDIEIVPDLIAERVESFTVYANQPNQAIASRRSAEVTIIDDDASWLFVDDPVIVEGTTPGSASAVFTVRRLGLTTAGASVGYAVADLTALAGPDYAADAAPGRLTFAPGVTSQTVTIPLTGDAVAEGVESFLLTLSDAQNVAVVKGTGVATVLDDDAAEGTGVHAVRQVYVGGSAWSAPFKQYLQAHGLGSPDYGYAIPGGAEQLQTLPWTNLDQLSITFADDVDVRKEDLTVRGTNLANYAFSGAASGFGYDLATHAATWTFDRPLAKDRLLIDLHSARRLNFQARLNVLPGDVDKSGQVVAEDFSQVKKRFFRSTAAPGPAGDTQYSPFHDVDGSGSIVAADFSAVKARFFNALPGSQPTAAALFGLSRVAGRGATDLLMD